MCLCLSLSLCPYYLRYNTHHETVNMIIVSTALQKTTAIHAKTRKQFKKYKLNWRCSREAKQALGNVRMLSSITRGLTKTRPLKNQYLRFIKNDSAIF